MPAMPSARYIGGRTGSRSAKPLIAAKPRDALDHGAEAGALAIGSVLAPAGYSHDHELRIELQQDIWAEAHLLKHARSEALDEEMRGRARVP